MVFSLHQYLVAGLKYSDGAANRRIRAAQLLNKRSEVLELFRARRVSLCTLSLILGYPEMLVEGVEQIIRGHSTKEKALGSRRSKKQNGEGRYVSAAVKKKVLAKDNCCSFRHQDGSVCGSK